MSDVLDGFLTINFSDCSVSHNWSEVVTVLSYQVICCSAEVELDNWDRNEDCCVGTIHDYSLEWTVWPNSTKCLTTKIYVTGLLANTSQPKRSISVIASDSTKSLDFSNNINEQCTRYGLPSLLFDFHFSIILQKSLLAGRTLKNDNRTMQIPDIV